VLVRAAGLSYTTDPVSCEQGCGSGSVLDPYSIGSVDPDPDPYSESGGGQKRPTKVEKNW
jgi:hypothetical protein